MQRINFINGQAPALSANNLNALQDYIEEAIQNAVSENSLKQHPIGSIYMSLNSTNPSELFGGTWEAIRGQFLLAENGGYKDIYAAGQTGGLEEVTLTANQSGVQPHVHSYTPRIQWYNTATTGNVLRGSTDYAIDCAPSSFKGNAKVDGGAADGGQQWTDPISGDALEAHSNMPPYLAVYMWKRTA